MENCRNGIIGLYKVLLQEYNYSMYRLKAKASRNQALIKYRRQNPDLTLVEIGQVFGITRQRVSQIIGNKNCRTCYHSRLFCSCREPEDMISFGCPDWAPL